MTPSVCEIMVKEFSADVGVSREIFAKHTYQELQKWSQPSFNPILWFLKIIK